MYVNTWKKSLWKIWMDFGLIWMDLDGFGFKTWMYKRKDIPMICEYIKISSHTIGMSSKYHRNVIECENLWKSGNVFARRWRYKRFIEEADVAGDQLYMIFWKRHSFEEFANIRQNDKIAQISYSLEQLPEVAGLNAVNCNWHDLKAHVTPDLHPIPQ